MYMRLQITQMVSLTNLTSSKYKCETSNLNIYCTSTQYRIIAKCKPIGLHSGSIFPQQVLSMCQNGRKESEGKTALLLVPVQSACLFFIFQFWTCTMSQHCLHLRCVSVEFQPLSIVLIQRLLGSSRELKELSTCCHLATDSGKKVSSLFFSKCYAL